MMPKLSEMSQKESKSRPRDVVDELLEDMEVQGEVTVVKEAAGRVDEDVGLRRERPLIP